MHCLSTQFYGNLGAGFPNLFSCSHSSRSSPSSCRRGEIFFFSKEKKERSRASHNKASDDDHDHDHDASI